MRELKFRASDDQGVYYSDDYTKEDFANENIGAFFTDNFGCNIEQFTGLKDKNGKDIYCGDYLVRDEGEPPFVVEWDDRQCRFKLQGEDGFWQHMPFAEVCEVIGNIHEN